MLSELLIHTKATKSVTNDCQGLIQSKGTDVCATGYSAHYLSSVDTLANANRMFCQCHWSLPTWGPWPTAGVHCRGHQWLQYGTISAFRWSCWCQFCWLLLFPMSQKCFMIQLFYWSFLFLRHVPWDLGQGPVRAPDLEIHSESPVPSDTFLLSLNQILRPWPPSLSRRVFWGRGFLIKNRHARPILLVIQIFAQRIDERSSVWAEIHATQLQPSSWQILSLC